MTIDEAKAAIGAGRKFGDVYPDVVAPPADHEELKRWFVYEHALAPVPPTADQVRTPRTSRAVARIEGYTGDECPTCFSMKMRRNGACLLCDACGATTGCS